MFIQMMCVSDVRPEGEFIACGLGKLEPAPARKVKDGFDDGCAMGQKQRLACIKVAAVKHDQGAALSGSARQVSPIDAALQPSTMKCNIVGTKPFKTPAKRGLEETAHLRWVRRRKLDIVDHVMPWFENVMHEFATCQIRGRCCTPLRIQGNSHLLDYICLIMAGTKKEALSRLF